VAHSRQHIVGGAAADALGVVAPARQSSDAVRLHLSLHVLEDKPQRAKIPSAVACERRAWRENWRPGDAYVGDRYYGENYRLFAQLEEAGCAYVLRLREQATIEVLEEIELSQTDRQAGVVRQAWSVLGCKARYRSTRVAGALGADSQGGAPVSDKPIAQRDAGRTRGGSLSPALADRALLPLDQMHLGLSPLAGGIAPRGGH
jgi:hypothetical protein